MLIGISSANTHDIKVIMDVINNTLIKRKPSSSYFAKKKRQIIIIYALIERTTLKA